MEYGGCSVTKRARRASGPVHLVEVEVIGVEPAQRVLHRLHDVPARSAAPVGPLAHGHEEFGREHHVVAAALQGLPDDLLGAAGRIPIGGVDEVDARIEGPVDDPDRIGDGR
jgi:hypothetical protein